MDTPEVERYSKWTKEILKTLRCMKSVVKM